MKVGPAGGAVMGGMVKRKFPVMMTVAGMILLLTGARLYQTRFSMEWLPTPEGIVLTEFEVYGSGGYWPNSVFYARTIPGHPSQIVGVASALGAGVETIGVGDRVGAFMPNRIESVIGMLAARASGVITSQTAPGLGWTVSRALYGLLFYPMKTLLSELMVPRLFRYFQI